MSTYPTTVRSRVSSERATTLALIAAFVAILGTAVILAIATSDSDVAHPGGRAHPVHSRFDGGPNEGTRGIVSRSQADSAVVRFDGGPQEGTRGAIVNPVALEAPSFDRGPRAGQVGHSVAPSQLPTPATPQTRFDGGPNEGTRGAVAEYSSSTRFDGGPNEGTRGQ